jgi:hypothetical protein
MSGMTWGELEQRFAGAERVRVATVAWRAAERVAPVIAQAADVYGPEALEWLNAIRGVLRTVERFTDGLRVSRFTMDLAAEIARGAATSAAGVVRLMGPSKAAEDAELAFAAAAFAGRRTLSGRRRRRCKGCGRPTPPASSHGHCSTPTSRTCQPPRSACSGRSANPPGGPTG